MNAECVGKPKKLYFLFDLPLGALIYLYFIVLILIDYDWCERCNISLLFFENNSRSITIQVTGGTIQYYWRDNIVAVITLDKMIDGNLERQIKFRAFHTFRLFLLTLTFQYISNWSKVLEAYIHQSA